MTATPREAATIEPACPAERDCAVPETIDILVADPRWESLRLAPLAERAFGAIFGRLGLSPEGREVSILACDDAEIARLNAEFRGKPAPTNVLSWPAFDLAPLQPGDPPPPPPPSTGFEDTLGDIAISYDTCAREAEERGIRLEDHVTHLLVHGMLHLLGYDHERDADAARMEALEVEVLATLGIANPY